MSVRVAVIAAHRAARADGAAERELGVGGQALVFVGENVLWAVEGRRLGKAVGGKKESILLGAE